MITNLTIVAFSGTDIGGFGHDASGELLVRWTQMGTFFPFMRNHTAWDTIRQEPWQFGPEVEDICRQYINFRYQLLPYIYSAFYEATRTGAPVMRPLVWEYSADPITHNLSDQFLVGEAFLVAPIYRPDTDRRLVYLPTGNWYDYWTGTHLAGEQYVTAMAPLPVMPIFVKEGSIIPRQPVVPHTGVVPNIVHFDIYAKGTGGSAYGKYYEDDGQTTRYRQGDYNYFNLKWNRVHPGQYALSIRPEHVGFHKEPSLWEMHVREISECVRIDKISLLNADQWSSHRDGWVQDNTGIHIRIRRPKTVLEMIISIVDGTS